MQLSSYLEPFKSAVLGTTSENGYPFSSYAPFYYDGSSIYIFISDIATHAKNMQQRPKASAFFIEDESQTQQIFARKRISLQCDVTCISKNDDSYTSIMEAFVSKQGATLTMLMGMADFNLYILTPIYGEATFGFGEAYNIGGENMNELVTRTGDSGHK
ncbi:pyridoxamine 5'-phosphate oxidase family protein [Sulfurovum sp.]|uniref:HugZ family pyridoxamine 5'-phosphate oxidase n=1 Tax=Sulfurovum sp. TaxID=1969726 RepID=UPI00286811A7|nr:pyridoxamine 5'-phosphate oxidase family protein [Sulfurovum sp.]